MLAGQKFCRPAAACGSPWRAYEIPIGNLCSWELMGIDRNRLLDCSMLAAGFGLGLVAGLGLAGLTASLVAALHDGSERLLAGFHALSGVLHARAPEESAVLCISLIYDGTNQRNASGIHFQKPGSMFPH